MNVEIRHLKTLERPNGDLIEIIKLNAHVLNAEQIAAEVGSALIAIGLRTFGSEAKMVNNQTIFGGYVRNESNGECIIAV
jgi:hypothetical protein